MASNVINVPCVQDPYKSLPLPKAEESACVRVLNIHGTTKDSPLSGTLEVVAVSRSEGPWFSALSYVWGTYRSPPDTINCNGHELNITASCHDALKALREMHGGIKIWVDAICINQADLNEKAEQIPMMPRVYQNAAAVYTWLGQDSLLLRQAIKAVSAAWELDYGNFIGWTRFSWVPQSIQYAISFPRNWLRLRQSICDIRKTTRSSGIPLEQVNLDCEWLYRAWTFQEFMLATNPRFFWGTTEISWLHMGGIFYFADEPKSKLRRATSYATTFGKSYDIAFRTFIEPWADIMSQFSWSWILQLEKMSMSTQLSVHRVLKREKVHSELLSGSGNDLSSNPPLADYERPLDLVYLDFFVYVTGCHISFLHLIADSGLQQALPGGPSWLPDWNTALETRTWLSSEYLHEMGRERIGNVIKGRHMDTPIGEIEMICVVEGRVLKVLATFHSKITFFDTVEEQYWQNFMAAYHTPQLDTANINEFEEEFVPRLAVMRLLYSWLKVTPSTRDFMEDPLWAIMSLFGSPGNGHAMPTILSKKNWIVMAAVKLLAYVHSAATESWSSDPERDSTIASLLLLIKLTDNPQALQVLEDIYRSMLGKRSFFTTEDGEIGSGPLLMRVGDRIAHIAGVGVPMLLRPHEPVDGIGNSYSVVGPVCFSTRHMGRVKIDWIKRETIALV
ncbi:putative heterokaryon incompatibility protein [Botrytis fragariae]|uniref:Putative heterokaryon incompatibility protein n=1 Tax=Botrytis fragariae TaxID=1964551 RepID=A0A8H6AJH1_9HELO|nr:putative heterokaryon incompatibility protein [Botrytis fragariae]KAF5868489.1 putative heterokaryon incompatibility protein [Botrytis fragariae]